MNTSKYIGGEFEINDQIYAIKLVCIPLEEFDAILRMDWISEHDVSLDCWKKKIRIKQGSKVVYFGFN